MFNNQKENEILFTAFFILTGLSMLGSAFVLYSILRYSSRKSCFTILLIWLHSSLFLEELVTLPFIYRGSEGVCLTIQFLHYYTGLMNMLVVFFVVTAHCVTILGDTWNIRLKISNYSGYIIVLFPLISLIPFATNDYQVTNNNPWCAPPHNGENTNWTLGVFYVWIWLLLFVSLIIVFYTFAQLWKTSDRATIRKFFSTVGLYSVLALLSWVPRSIVRMLKRAHSSEDNTPYFVSYMPINLSGLQFFFVFLLEKKSLVAFEKHAGDFEPESFSWEAHDLLALLDTVSRSTSFADTHAPRATEIVARGGVMRGTEERFSGIIHETVE
jgi:hypothetical protein